MGRSALGPLLDMVQQLYGDKLRTQIDTPSEVSLNFVIGTEVGLLGLQLDFVYDEEGPKSLLMAAMPLILGGEGKIGFYDLCNIDFAGYELIDELRSKLGWGSLDLEVEDGSKTPMLSRAEILDPTRTLQDQDFPRIGTALQMLELDAILVTPAIAALSSGVPFTKEGVSLAMTEVHASVQ